MNTATYVKPSRRKGLLSYLWPSKTEAGSHPTLVLLGLGILFCFMAMVFLPGTVWSNCRFIINPIAALWVGLALLKTRCRLRFVFPFYILMLLQVWMVVSMLFAQQYVPKEDVSGIYLWYPLELGIPYVVATVLFGLMPGMVRYVINGYLALCATSGFLALLQSAHFGPAIRIADFYVYRSIEGWANVAGVRASGLINNPNGSVMILVIAVGLIAYKSTLRRLTWVDWMLWAVFLMASFAAQHRSSMPIIALAFIITTLVMARRRPQTIALLFGTAAIAFLAAITVGRHQFAYTFETDWTNSPELEARVIQERAAYAVYLQHPVFGVGPSPAGESLGKETSEFSNFNVENLYASVLFTLGAPGLALVLTMYVSALVLAIIAFLNRLNPYPARILALIGAFAAFALLFNGNVGVNLTQYYDMFCYMLLMAIVQFTVNPHVTTPRRLRVSPYLQRTDVAGPSNSLTSMS